MVVLIGNNLEYRIGQLSYGGVGEGQLPKPVMIGVAVGGCVLLLIVIGILILYRRKSTESTRVSYLDENYNKIYTLTCKYLPQFLIIDRYSDNFFFILTHLID